MSSDTNTAPVSEALARIEVEIDSEHRSNDLLKERRSQAMWSFLAQIEEMFIIRQLQNSPDLPMLADAAMHLAKWPLRWLWRGCVSDGPVSTSHDEDRYRAASALSILGDRHTQYETVYTLAYRGRHKLVRQGNLLVVPAPPPQSVRRDAYDRLVDEQERAGNPRLDLPPAAIPVVRVRKHRFRYRVGDALYQRACECLSAAFGKRFRLPSEWKLGTHTLAEYRSVFEFLFVRSVLHHYARRSAIDRGCPALGYADALIVTGRRSLARSVARQTGLSRDAVESIVRILTYGECGIKEPDIALQPLVPFGTDQIGWSPYLVEQSAFERNLIVLLNRFPKARADYAALSVRREHMLRDELVDGLKRCGFEYWHGRVPNWGGASEVDFVAIDRRTRQALLMELKAFLAPADPGEVEHRRRDVEKGIEQIRRRQEMFGQRGEDLRHALGISDDYHVTFAVVSQTSAGNGLVCDEEVPVVRSSDLLRRIEKTGDLASVATWLSEFRFLPTEGADYEEIKESVEIGNWTAEWYRVNTQPGILEGRQDFGGSAVRE